MNESGHFTRTKEDFVCEQCGMKVAGNGYTNHCPSCLASKHVDIHPGDRAETCGGCMKAIAVEGSSPNYRLRHKCEHCGIERVVDIAADDSLDAVVSLARKHAA